jgi:hypothetical protein
MLALRLIAPNDYRSKTASGSAASASPASARIRVGCGMSSSIQTRHLRHHALRNQSSASTFLGLKRCEAVLLVEQVRRPTLRVIDGDQSRTAREAYSVAMEWQTINSAPFCCDLQLAVINAGGVHALVFPCRRVLRGWVKAETNEPVHVYPTHWREWDDALNPSFARPSPLS